jgi:hypothetical protein
MTHCRSLALFVTLAAFAALRPAVRAQDAKQAPYTASYDVGDILRQPGWTAARLVRQIVAADPKSWQVTTPQHGTIHILNDSRLVVRATRRRHVEVGDLVRALRQLGDVSVRVRAKLYEVDEAFYTRLGKVKRLSREEMEKEEERFLAGKRHDGTLFTLLKKQKEIQAGEAVADNGGEAAFLSRYKMVCVPPLPGKKDPQVVMEGVSFRAVVTISADRRYARLELTEKAVEIQEMRKVTVWLSGNKEATGRVPILNDTMHSDAVEIPDGGAMLVPVHVRPHWLRERDRWWVLSLTPIITIGEEEQQILKSALTDGLPAVLADVLNNPRLKLARACFGTLGDKHFALVDSTRWAWPKDFRPADADHKLASARKTGDRLLGIRIAQFRWAGKDSDKLLVTVTLLNAGGSANGAVAGGCRVLYVVRAAKKGPAIQLEDAAGR